MATRKYKEYKKQVSYDGGTTWIDVLPVETVKMPVYGESCEIGYSAKAYSSQLDGYTGKPFVQKLPPMDVLTTGYTHMLWGLGGNSVYIGTGVTEIANNAFEDFGGQVRNVIFEEPSSLKTIGASAFCKNSYTESISIPDSVSGIGAYSFATSGSSSLQLVEIGSGCTYIGDNAFRDIKADGGDTCKIVRMRGETPPVLGQTPFTNISIDYGVPVFIVSDNSLSQYRSSWNISSGDVISDTSLGNSAKAETNKAGDMVQTPTGTALVTDVYQLPNDGSSSLTRSDFSEYIYDLKMSWLKIGDSVKIIPDNAFKAVDSSNGYLVYLNIGNGVETIGKHAFQEHRKLLSIHIPGNVKKIDDYAFNLCESVRDITIGSGCTYIGTSVFDNTNLKHFSLPDTIEYLGAGNFTSADFAYNSKLPLSLKVLPESCFGSMCNGWGDCYNNFISEIILPSIETIGSSALTSFQTAYLEIGGEVEEIGRNQCKVTSVYVGAEEPPTIMDIYVIDNPEKIEWLKTSLICVPDNLIDKYKTAYGWCLLRQHIFPLSERTNILNFAGNHKFCGLYNKDGGYVDLYYNNHKEQGVYKYGEYDGNTTLTSGETVWNSSQGYGSGGPDKIWVGDNVEYVDKNSFPMLSSPNLIVFGTGLKEFVFLDEQCTYVFKTTTPPEFSCKNYQVDTRTKPDGTTETGVTISAKQFIMYVPDNAVNTYKEWLRDNGVIQALPKWSVDEILEDYLVFPLSEFFNLSDYTKKRWVKVPGQYECSGTTKHVKEKEQTTNDYINWTDTGRTRRGKKVIGYFSEDCGYTPYTGKFRATLSDGTTVELPCDGSSTLTENETSGMMETYDVEYVEIGTCVSTIGWDILRKKANVKAVKIPNTVTTIDASAFDNCSGITWVNIPNSVTIIDAQAFQNCTGLTSITIPSTVRTVGWAAFANCLGLKELVVGSNTIADLAFTECSVLSSITMTSGVTSIGGGAFAYCGRLILEMTVTIPNTVTSIGAEAFLNCITIKNITIPSGVTSIGDRAFGACGGLESITVEATAPPTLGTNALNNGNDCPIYVPAGSLSSYQSAWSTYANRLQAIP